MGPIEQSFKYHNIKYDKNFIWQIIYYVLLMLVKKKTYYILYLNNFFLILKKLQDIKTKNNDFCYLLFCCKSINNIRRNLKLLAICHNVYYYFAYTMTFSKYLDSSLCYLYPEPIHTVSARYIASMYWLIKLITPCNIRWNIILLIYYYTIYLCDVFLA